MTEAQAEAVRLVVWDLDDTFWRGTLTEGGVVYQRALHDTVIELASRGIMSSICSKNDFDQVRDVLVREGIWDYFIFPSINWEPKGPRLAALIEAVQLRAPTVLFIDDNPMNLGEASHYVPGIQVADEKLAANLLSHPGLKGKPDPELKRLGQYRLLEQRQREEKSFGSDNTQFLRSSGLVVEIEHDLVKHVERAVELINRTNQLNFTKRRLPEDLEAAKKELLELLSNYDTQAGIIRVRDRFGDYGYCGLYVTRTGGNWKNLLHFCFSCRILNMGVEAWLYNKLGRPRLKVVGEVLTDLLHDQRTIDWISNGSGAASTAEQNYSLDYFYARGACDLTPIAHYFELTARAVVGDYNIMRDGANLRLEHSIFARYALLGITNAEWQSLVPLGYREEDFTSSIPGLPADAHGAALLSFWTDADRALYRHRRTGAIAPLSLPGVGTNMRDLTSVADDDPDVSPEFRDELRNEFEYLGRISEEDFKTNVRLIISRLPRRARKFILLANEDLRKKGKGVIPHKRMLNRWTRDVAAEFPEVELLPITSFLLGTHELISVNHFDRMVYYRVHERIMNAFRPDEMVSAAE